jgi:hypothetical protein
MLKYAKVNIGIKGNCSYKTRFNYYKPTLLSKMAYLQNKKPAQKVSNFDCDYTYIDNKCLYTIILIDNVPLLLQICKDCEHDYCTLTVK